MHVFRSVITDKLALDYSIRFCDKGYINTVFFP